MSKFHCVILSNAHKISCEMSFCLACCRVLSCVTLVCLRCLTHTPEIPQEGRQQQQGDTVLAAVCLGF